MIYKGYVAWYEHDTGDEVLHGRIAGIHDLITFVAPTMRELEHEFHVSVDDYLRFCVEDGREPDVPPNPNGSTPLESSYRGFAGSFEIDPENGMLHGHIDEIDEVVTFVADRLWDLNREFRARVDDYLERSTGDVVEVHRPYAGSLRAAS